MRRLLLALACLSVLLSAAVATACGADDVNPAAVAEAADATRRAESARVSLRTTVSGAGLPVPITITGRGVTATAEPRADLTLDLGPLLALGGVQGSGAMRMVVPDQRVFVDPPSVPGLELPGGARWVSVDLRRAARAVGLDPAGIGALLRLDPAIQLEALRSAGAIREVGEEEIAGAPTTHYRGEVRVRDYLRALPPERRRSAERAIAQLERLSPEADLDRPTPTDLWVDEDGLVRRLRQTTALPAQNGMPAGRVEVAMELSDFGTRLDAEAPPADEVFDATDALARAAKAAPALGTAG